MRTNAHTYYSNGKLLLSGEYVVLDGALSLALPTTYGQYLKVAPAQKPVITWKSTDINNETWFEATFSPESLHPSSGETASASTSSDREMAKVLLTMLRTAKRLNPSFLANPKGSSITTKLTFPRNWGLGSSSTLLNNIAQWAKVDAYELLRSSFPGSGYDIACARHPHPVFYQLKNKKPVVRPSAFNPAFSPNLYFIHLNKKQDSREGIRLYKEANKDKTAIIHNISAITRNMARTRNLKEFETLMEHHEDQIADLLQLPKVKERLFKEYPGAVKSLGAWGGDFVLATGNKDTPAYFKEKGYNTVLPYRQMAL